MAVTSANRLSPIGVVLLATLASVAGLALVASNTLNSSVGDAHPTGFAGLAGQSAVLHHELDAALAPEKGATVAMSQEDTARRLLAGRPLDAAALTYLGLEADARRDLASARRLMTLALRSEERAVRPRLWLMNDDVRRRDYAGAIDHFDRLVRTGPADNQQAITAMTAIVRDPASRAPLARKLATNPSWRNGFLSALNEQGTSPDIVYHLTAQTSATTGALGEQAGLLSKLLRNHEYERAYLAWINFLPQASLGHVGPVFDGQFENLAGPLPFNWNLTDGTDGSSEFGKPKGLIVAYLGTAPATLAEQTLMLAAGRYRLTVLATGDDANNQLSWTVTCDGTNDPLQSIKLSGLKPQRQNYDAMVDVPGGCGAQRLALSGAPGEFPHTANAQIEAIRIEPVK